MGLIFDGIVQREAPEAHASSHETGGDDLLTLSNIPGAITQAQHFECTRRIHIPTDLRSFWDAVAAGNIAYDAAVSRIYAYMNNANDNLRLFFQLPPDFSAFITNGIRIKTYKNNVAVALTLTLLSGGVADSGINALPITPTGIGAWENMVATALDSYSAGDWCEILVAFTCAGVGVQGQVAEIEIDYTADY